MAINKKRNCVVLLQHRKESEYNDFIGKYYHFPKKYFTLLNKDNIEFVYYEPIKRGEGVYFGYGEITKMFEDRREKNHYFAEISNYKSFSAPVPFKDKQGNPRESGPTYNPQNAVRKIESNKLDEICLDGGIVLSFKADSHLMKVLGEQLIETETVGILELIKNAYDAGASFCKVRIEKVPNLPKIDESEYLFNEYNGPIIIIEDDGTGMDKNTIENGWLRPASTIKTGIKERMKKEKEKAIKEENLGVYNSLIDALKKEYKGRIPLGEKGVGRFAVHRLGRKLLVKTKTKENNYEFILKIDWDKFDRIQGNSFTDLDSVGVSLFRQPVSRDYGEAKSGTQIVIYEGREGFEFDKDSIEYIHKTLKALKTPYEGTIPAGFNVIFECPQLKDISEDRSSLIDEFLPPLFLEGRVDEEGIFNYSFKFNPPRPVPLPEENLENLKEDLKVHNKDYWKKAGDGNYRNPECGEFYIQIKAWYRRKKPWLDDPNYKQFTEYLEAFGGISIFRDGLNVFPAEWGAKVDWLDLSKRHIKQGFRISYYNIVGNIELTQAENIDLVDKTDRQGIIESKAFKDLKDLIRNIILFILEHHFMAKRREYEKLTKGLIREPRKLGRYSKQASNIMDSLLNKYDIKNDPFILLSEFDDFDERKNHLINLSDSLKNLEESLKQMQEVQDLLTEQAGFGLAIGVAVHEIAKITANFYYGVKSLLDSKKLDIVKLKDLKESSQAIRNELNRLSPQRAVRNEPPAEFNIKKSIEFEYEVFRRKLKKFNISLKLVNNGGFNVYARYGAVNQVLANLFTNSIYWVDTITSGKKRIVIKINTKHRFLVFADSGPGIHQAILPYLFEPGYSMKIPPSGLGLYICKYYMRSMKGDIYIAPEKEKIKELPGAQLIIDFYNVPLNKEDKK